MAKSIVCPAEIPPMLSQEQRQSLPYTPQCRQRWSASQTPPCKADDIDNYLAEFAWLKEREVALECLFDGGFNVPKAVKLLHARRRTNFKARRNLDKHLTSELYQRSIATHGKRFDLVKQALGEAINTRQVVSHYYLWKRSDEFKEWRTHQIVKKTRKTKRQIERLLGGAEDTKSEPKALVAYHHQLCEVCATGGSLQCCHGCPRAYHISCAQPPIVQKSTTEQWYCIHCHTMFGGPTPKQVPSEENEHCMIYERGPTFPRSLLESMTDGSSSEAENEASESVAGSESSGEVESDDSGKINSSKRQSTLSETERNRSTLPDIFVASLSVMNEESLEGEDSTELNHATANSSLVEHRTLEEKRPGAGRKRHRKMLAPRRIVPSSFRG